MRHAVFREFYTERDVIMEERRQRIESDPEGMLYERFLAEAFTVHPYRRPVLGYPDDQRYLDMGAMRSFYRKYHAPNNTVIAIVGDVDTETVMRLIRKYFSTIPHRRINRPPIIPEPPQRAERRIDVSFDASPLIAIGYHKPAAPAFDDYVFDVIDCLLTNGRSSRLYRELIDRRQIAEFVSTNNGIPASRYANLFTFWAAPREPYRPSELEAAIYEEIERLQREPVTAKEMERVRNQIRSDFIGSLDSNEGLAAMLSYHMALMGDYSYFTTYLNTIEKVTPTDIMRVAGQYLRAENRTVATLTRTKQPSRPSSFSQPLCPNTHGNKQGKSTQDDNR
jgi:predicted Zn-dependent peptidase